MKLEAGRYGVLIKVPFIELFTSLKDQVAEAQKWLEKNHGTLERWEHRMDGVFALFSIPTTAEWEFDWGTPELVAPEIKTSRQFDGSEARDAWVYEEAKAVAKTVTDWGSGIAILALLFLLANRKK